MNKTELKAVLPFEQTTSIINTSWRQIGIEYWYLHGNQETGEELTNEINI
jgi:hypothetical protein